MPVSDAMVTELWARGFAALPVPREVRLEPGETCVDAGWCVYSGDGVAKDNVALETLSDGFAAHFGKPPARGGGRGANTFRLEIRPGTVAAGASEGIAAQGYRLEIAADAVRVTGNGPAGLFYGVQTLLALLRPAPTGAALNLPRGRIDDWPDRELRCLHYDTKHHQDRLDAVKSMIARAAAFKANAVAWEIEDKFAYRCHPEIGAPGAFTAEEVQELSAFALRRFVELIPIVQGPSHLAFVLKHPKFAALREDPANNYMLCPSNEKG
ncbi:MAG TPA: glycoside hydrolase family 20 zincin-like fold domain-containing protein, partial [Planctomycetota bacterium]|nr:glycoside hydrolase family 20 zincin-like fold domain-containing protein [Planctomycetota bacterium]